MAEQTEDIVVDGVVLDLDDFTFREMRELRQVIKDHILGTDENVDVDDLSLAEYLPAAIFVLKKRDDPGFTIEQALDLKMRDVIQPHKNGNGSRPTKGPAQKRKSSARG